MFSKGWEFVRPTLPFLVISKGPSWSWLDGSWYYGSWIYNYLCNQCLSPLKLWASNPIHGEVYSIQHYVIKFVSDLWQVCGFLRVHWLPSPINWPPRYNWNIVESGFEYHIPFNLFSSYIMASRFSCRDSLSKKTFSFHLNIEWLLKEHHGEEIRPSFSKQSVCWFSGMNQMHNLP